MIFTQNGQVNTKYAQLLEWLEDMGVPTDHRDAYAKEIVESIETRFGEAG